MPPKKYQEQQTAPVITWTILPVIFNSQLANEALRKPVTLKKHLDTSKLIEMLKDKGIEKYIEEGKLNRQGELFICENMNSAGQQFLAQLRKPVDPKKDQKKDTKKDSKKEQVVAEEVEKPIQFDFPKNVTEFLFYLGLPSDRQTLQVALNNGLNPQVVIWVEQKVKEGSQKPNYDLLNMTRTVEDFMNEMNNSSLNNVITEKRSEDVSHEHQLKKDMLKAIQQSRMKVDSNLEDTIIIEVPYLKDIQHPEKDGQQFLTSLFKNLCQLSLKKEKYQAWSKQQKVTSMVPSIKETVKKEVVVEEKKEEKKGGKKQPAGPPVTQIVEEVIEKRYQSIPQNIKSDLSLYKRISQQRKRDAKTSVYWKMLDDLAYCISTATEPHQKIEEVKDIGSSVWTRYKNKPVNRVGVQNLKDKLPQIFSSPTSNQLTYQIALSSIPIPSEICLSAIQKYFPSQAALQHEYKLEQFTQLSNRQGQRIFYNYSKRQYVEKLEAKELNSRVNQELEQDPKVYYGQCTNDGYNLLILARTNPPGRVLYYNNIFDWRVLPNFQFWEQCLRQQKEGAEFWDYNWREAGNLKILRKKMMPTDNAVLAESTYTCGDSQQRMITLSKGETDYGLHVIKGGNHLLWKHDYDLKTMVYTTGSSGSESQQIKNASIEICIQNKQFTILFRPYPTICWHYHDLQQSRTFGPQGQITKRMKDGSVQILYPNGDVSLLRYGTWSHIKANKRSAQGTEQQQYLKVEKRIQTDKIIQIREDSTVFVSYSNKEKSILFKDGTMIRKKGNQKLQIKNPSNIIIRIYLPRDKDFNVIGSGSAFAYLGQSNILERSYDGALYELYHPTFSWHTYTEGIDRAGTLSHEQVMLIAYPDQSIMKIGDTGTITFLNKAKEGSQSQLSERWIQLFTSPEYHQEGVYDVDLIEGQFRTRDAESNHFRVRIDGNGKSDIAVSFNIGNVKEEKNDFGSGLHVPDQNYFLPPPQNCILPKLFVIYPDGSGEQYLAEEQIQQLKTWNSVSANFGDKKITQYCKQMVPCSQYMHHSFSAKIDHEAFILPNLLESTSIRPNNISYDYNPICFRSIEQIEWCPEFSKVKKCQEIIRNKRKALKDELQSYKHKLK